MTRAYEYIAVELFDGFAEVTLDRPQRLNSFIVQMHEELADVLDSVEAEASVRALILTGRGRAFCAGQDLSERVGVAQGNPVDLGETVGRYYGPLVSRLSQFGVPVISAVNGVAAGAGANIALAADIVLAARGASFIQSFAKVGLIPDSGGTWILPRLVGQARALGLALTGLPLSAERAESMGLIWQVVDDEYLMDEARALARKLMAGPTSALVATKRAMRASNGKSLDEALADEQELMRTLGFSANYAEGVTAFLEKRDPVFTHKL
jgi:2-(1,2-epoxy-1,2-dihydrophenyl)acetyl-CoA isomerase